MEEVVAEGCLNTRALEILTMRLRDDCGRRVLSAAKALWRRRVRLKRRELN